LSKSVQSASFAQVIFGQFLRIYSLEGLKILVDFAMAINGIANIAWTRMRERIDSE